MVQLVYTYAAREGNDGKKIAFDLKRESFCITVLANCYHPNDCVTGGKTI